MRRGLTLADSSRISGISTETACLAYAATCWASSEPIHEDMTAAHPVFGDALHERRVTASPLVVILLLFLFSLSRCRVLRVASLLHTNERAQGEQKNFRLRAFKDASTTDGERERRTDRQSGCYATLLRAHRDHIFIAPLLLLLPLLTDERQGKGESMTSSRRRSLPATLLLWTWWVCCWTIASASTHQAQQNHDADRLIGWLGEVERPGALRGAASDAFSDDSSSSSSAGGEGRPLLARAFASVYKAAFTDDGVHIRHFRSFSFIKVMRCKRRFWWRDAR